MNLERRKYVRFPVIKDFAKPINLYFDEAKTTPPIPSILVDLSPGGIGLLTFVPIDVGKKLLLEIDIPGLKTHLIEGRVMWTLTKGNSWRIGLAFTKINKEDFKNITKMADDYIDCETKLSLGIKDVCFPKCNYWELCTKPVKISLKKK